MSPTDKLPICANCRKATQAKTHQCAHCMKFFHTACTKLSTIMREKATVKVCRPCLTALNSPSLGVRTRTALVSSTDSNSSRPPSPPLLLPQSDSVLAAILAKVEAIDKRTASMEKKNDEKLAEIETKVNNCQATLDQIPALATRITAVEAEITQVEERLGAAATESAAGTSSGAMKRVGHIESAVKELSNVVASINADRAKLSAELLVSGVSYGNCSDLKSLVLAVFRAVLPEISADAIVAVRQLRSKAVGRSPAPAVDPVEDSSSQAPVAGPKVPPIVVLLSSASIAHNVIIAKARHRKLYSSELDTDLLRQAGTDAPLQPSLININEFLPADLHRLRQVVKEAAKKHGFSTFIRSGEVFIKRKKEDTAIRIASVNDLENFLLGLQ